MALTFILSQKSEKKFNLLHKKLNALNFYTPQLFHQFKNVEVINFLNINALITVNSAPQSVTWVKR